ALFWSVFEELRRDSPDPRPVIVWTSRWGPVGAAFLRRRFGLPFGTGKGLAITANTDSWIYVLNSCKEPSLVVWKTSFFGKAIRLASQEKARWAKAPDSVDNLSETALVAGPNSDLATTIAGLELQAVEAHALKHCRYCTGRCLLIKACEEGLSL